MGWAYNHLGCNPLDVLSDIQEEDEHTKRRNLSAAEEIIIVLLISTVPKNIKDIISTILQGQGSERAIKPLTQRTP